MGLHCLFHILWWRDGSTIAKTCRFKLDLHLMDHLVLILMFSIYYHSPTEHHAAVYKTLLQLEVTGLLVSKIDCAIQRR